VTGEDLGLVLIFCALYVGVGACVLSLAIRWKPTLIERDDVDTMFFWWPVLLVTLVIFVAVERLYVWRVDLSVWRARRQLRRSIPRCRVVR
jgi:hypothetical protein